MDSNVPPGSNSPCSSPMSNIGLSLLERINCALERKRGLPARSDEKELPVAVKRSTVTAEASATSGPALQFGTMESLSFSKDEEQEVSKLENSEILQAMNRRDLTRIEMKRARDIEKQAKHLAKQEQKQKRLEEREAKKRKQDQEKIARKYVTAVLDSEVLTDGGGAILQSLENMGVQYEVKKLPCDATIGWMRNRVEFVAEENSQIKRNSTYTEEDQILMRIKAADLASMIDSGPSTPSSSILASYISKMQRLLPNKKFTLIITGLDSYAKLAKAKSALKKPQSHPLPAISKSALDDALLELQMQHHCCVHFCENADELAQIVCSFTKAVAEKPYKKPNGVAFDIYMDNHEKGLSRVDKDGKGLLDVWVRQLQQFKSVGYDTAAAIVQRFPSPYLLFQEFRNCSTALEASLLLQDIEVRRGHGVLATSRRVGPELSKRICTFLMSSDGYADLAKS